MRGLDYTPNGPPSTGARPDPRLSRFDDFARAMRADRRLAELAASGPAGRLASATLRGWYRSGDAAQAAPDGATLDALAEAERLYDLHASRDGRAVPADEPAKGANHCLTYHAPSIDD